MMILLNIFLYLFMFKTEQMTIIMKNSYSFMNKNKKAYSLNNFNQNILEIGDWEKLSVKQKKQKVQPKNIYIIKPGEITNQGAGIVVLQKLEDIKTLIQKQRNHQNGQIKTYIIQQYIDRPLLYNLRKFDIRCYLLVTSQNGILKGYIFQEGYIRTSSTQYTTNNLRNKMIHLTNDAIQKKSDQYGKYEGGNKVFKNKYKISYKEFQKYLQINYPQYDFNKTLQDINNIAYISICSVYELIDSKKKNNSFEVFYFQSQIFGLDYMIDQDFKTYLIEINSNPCFNTDSSLLSRIVPKMIDNAFKIAIDSIFLPPYDIQKYLGNRKDIINENIYQQNRFELIFDELIDGPKLQEIKKLHKNNPLNTQSYENDENIEIFDIN